MSGCACLTRNPGKAWTMTLEIEDYAEFAITMNELIIASKAMVETWHEELPIRPAPRNDQENKLISLMAFWVGTAKARVERAEIMMAKIARESSSPEKEVLSNG